MKLKHTKHRKANILNRKRLIDNQNINNAKNGANNFAVVSGDKTSLLKMIWKMLKMDDLKKELKSNDSGNRASRKFKDGIEKVAGGVHKGRFAHRNT